MSPQQSTPWVEDAVRLAAVAGVSVLMTFLVWEFIETQFAASDESAHQMHYARGISSSLITAALIGRSVYGRSRRRASALEDAVERHTQELRDAQRMLQLIVDATPAALVVLDKRFNVVQANRTAEDVHGGVLRGRLCYEALAARDDVCASCPAVESFAGQGVGRIGQRRDPRTGEVLEVECHPLSLGDGDDYVLLVEHIVTEQKKLEARLLHQEKMAAFGLLAAEVAHDMGNPLSSIDAQLQLLDRENLAGETTEVFDTIHHEVRRLHRILHEIVNFARRRRDEACLVSVQAVVEDAVRLLRHDRRMQSISLVNSFDDDTPAVFMIEDHLVQVALNLLINAVDAMPDGGTLRIEIQPAGNVVALRIHDTGIGMDRSTLKQCIEPLFTTKEEGKGTGLGLSITKDIIEAAGGSLELHSSLGHGTTIIVSIPAARLSEADGVVAGNASPE